MGFNSGFKGLMKICPVGAELFDTDGQTDRHDECNSAINEVHLSVE